MEHEREDKVAYSSSCPNITLSWRWVHHCYDRMVKGTIAGWEDYPNWIARTKGNRRLKVHLRRNVTHNTKRSTKKIEQKKGKKERPPIMEAGYT